MDKNYIPCITCGKKATWSYMPGDANYCDDCVPRGCSCNNELKDGIDYDSEEAKDPSNYYEKLDEKSRRMPCCEFSDISEEFHTDKKMLAFGWETYYKYNPKQEERDMEIEKCENKLERK